MDVMMHLLEVSDELARRAQWKSRDLADHHMKKVKQIERIQDRSIRLRRDGQKGLTNGMLGNKWAELTKAQVLHVKQGTKKLNQSFHIEDMRNRKDLAKKAKNIKYGLIGAGALAAGVGGALLYKRMKNKDKKVQ